MKLHEMIIDSEKQEVRIGKEIDIDPLQIESIEAVRIWEFDKYLPEEERSKIDPERLANAGSLIKMSTGSTPYYVVMESKNHING